MYKNNNHKDNHHHKKHTTAITATTDADASFWTEAKRYMRYATAVYGQAMIHAAHVDARGHFLSTATMAATKQVISQHIDVPPQDIIVMDVDYAGDYQHLRHMVVVDHKHKKVVLSIRGTFTLDEIVMDAAAFSRHFCGGEAHSEMATMAERVWAAAGPTVQDMLRQHDGYELIVTGHSLGAGTACLLMVLLESKRYLPKTQPRRCFAYAAPPVFTPLEFVPQTVQATTCFVHENDAIPFLSVNTVRQLFQQIRAVDDTARHDMTRRQRYQVLLGLLPPPSKLIESVRHAERIALTPKEGAPVLHIPANTVLWLQKQRQHGKTKIKDGPQQDDTQNNDDDYNKDYVYQVWRPRDMTTLGIRVNPDMLLDHFPPRYEHALDHLRDCP
jgi:hypothetical protein